MTLINPDAQAQTALTAEALQREGERQLSVLRALAQQPLTSTQRAARDMYGGDHLGSLTSRGQYAYWRGPMLALDETLRGEQAQAQARQVREFQNVLTRSFTSVNLIREIVDREVGASAARMTWEARADEDALLQLWWRQGGHHVERVIRTALTTARREGRAVLRFRVGTLPVTGRTPEAVALALRLEDVPPETARVLEHPDTLARVGVYAYQWQGLDAAEVCFLDAAGNTIVRVMQGGRVEDSAPLALGGRLTLLEISLPALVTEQVIQNQAAYNTVVTMSVRNTELAGFVERYGINLEPPYRMVDDPSNPGQQKREYLPFATGPARLNLWRQATMDKTDAGGNYQGETSLGAGQYGRLEPSSAEPLLAAAGLLRRNIYSETGQMFVLMAEDATASGRSREVAMSDFDARREVVRDAARYLIGDVGETALALMYALAGQPRPGVQVLGQVRGRAIGQDAQERQADLNDIAAGVMTPAEVRARRGLDEAPELTPVPAPPPTPPPES
ncbi:hypothetical protein [uncultured Deinococcus sp.]|uniref:hypothetical protein n=1 Tax=uncultured Deinococcus sp. TaxID=158789 RepID=UPI0037479685